MPRKKQKTKRAPRRREANKIVKGLQEAVNYAGDRAVAGPMLPSAEAMGLAEMLLDRATRKKKRGEVTQIVVAEMIESALNVRRAAAEAGGAEKGKAEATEKFNRQIIDGVLARIAGYANHARRMGTIALAFSEAQVLAEALRKAGYGPQPDEAVQRYVWKLHDTGNGRLEASHERV